jgi:orotidine-5'-phosphate decarboxylase
MNTPLDQIIVALDNKNKEEVLEFLSLPENKLSRIKMGLELFCGEGPSFVHQVYDLHQKNIFLDLKLHDIPNTVAKSIRALKDLPIEFLTIHLSGGRAMLEAAKEAQEKYLPKTKLLGVSYLTSLKEEDFKELYGHAPEAIFKAFERLFQLAIETSTDGIVCSAHELELINRLKKEHKSSLLTVCPGIRFQDEIDQGQTQDQARVLSPEKAFQKGASFLVMGRSITEAKNLSARIEQLSRINL